MPLIQSISGIRGTIGGVPGENLTPIDIIQASAAFGAWVLDATGNAHVLIGRDGRISGPVVSQLVAATLVSMGIRVTDLGLSTTPTVEMAVPRLQAGGGIILTASHNPREWNALKLLNDRGEFISAAEGADLIRRIHSGQLHFAAVDDLGTYSTYESAIAEHIDAILRHPLVDIAAVRKKSFRIAVDAVNSTGAISMPPLLEALGCEVILLNGEVTGDFAHNPEPLAEHLTQLSEAVVREKADLGIAVDPDVDRLVLMNEDGTLFGEEYTLVAVADYVLPLRPGDSVSNLSSSRALRDITRLHGGQHHASAVGEVHVVEKMKAVRAVIGGEGNGGIIVPDLHYGRDAMAGAALFLSHLARKDLSMSALRNTYPSYSMVKDKMPSRPGLELDRIFDTLMDRFKGEQINREDGLKIDFREGWVHLRPSNTEPIIRIYAEAATAEQARMLVDRIRETLPNS
jgi:phosphomannomutase